MIYYKSFPFHTEAYENSTATERAYTVVIYRHIDK